MKNIFIVNIAALLLSWTSMQAQTPPVTMVSTSNTNLQVDPFLEGPRPISKRKVPANIQEAFHYNFPNIKKVKWRIEEQDLYAADFIDENHENVSAYFNTEGVITELSILKNTHNISAQLIQKINSEFNTPHIDEIIEVRDYYNDEIFYVINILENEEITEHYIDPNGNIIDKKEEEVKGVDTNNPL